jgi:dihydroxyacetone kinase
MNAVTPEGITQASLRAASVFIAHRDRFNALDAAGGDGDMGPTLATVSQAIIDDAAPSPQTVGAAFGNLARIIAKTSGSSLSAVAMTGLMALARSTEGRDHVPWSEVSALLDQALTSMQKRSKAVLGDKTVLDGLSHIAIATHDVNDALGFARAACDAVERALAHFRPRPAAIGRMRLEPDKGVGRDDPGMIALAELVAAVALKK